MDTDLAFAGMASQAAALREARASSRDLVSMYLERIERIDPQLNAFRSVFAERAQAEAAEADRRIAAGEEAPLLGVPVAVKDEMADVAGDVTAFGTSAFDQPAGSDSSLVRRLRQAGAVLIGKTNLPELAICGFTESKTFGITRNPWNPELTPGGSSGGSAAAVAAGLVAGAHASDGAGSIRIPAANCGLFGLKPQNGRVVAAPYEGHWQGLSVNGCVTRTVADTALFLDVTRADGPGAPVAPKRPFAEAATALPGALRVAFSTRPMRAAAPPIVSDEVVAPVAETAELLRALGHDVAERDPDYGAAGNNFTPRYLRGTWEDVRSAPHPERLEARTRGFGRLGRMFHPKLIQRARRKAAVDARRINSIFERADVLITPVNGELPIEVGRWQGAGAIRTLLGMSRTYPFTPIWNHLGNPAASVPAGFTEEGLPLSVQLIGRPGDEATLLSLAAQIEAERPWAARRPAIAG